MTQPAEPATPDSASNQSPADPTSHGGAPKPARSAAFLPMAVTGGLLLATVGLAVAVLVSPGDAEEPAPERPPIRTDPGSPAVAGEISELRGTIRTLQAEWLDLAQELRDLGAKGPGSMSVSRDAVTRFVQAGDVEGLREAAFWLERDRDAAQRRVDRTRALNDADLVFTAGDREAAVFSFQDGEPVLTARVPYSGMTVVRRFLRERGREPVDADAIVRAVKRTPLGSPITNTRAVETISEYFRPRAYVPTESDPGRMIAFSRRRHVMEIGYLLEESPERLLIASTKGEEVVDPSLLFSAPFIGDEEVLLDEEPRIDFFQYAVLRAAKRLEEVERAVYQRVVIDAEVKLNPAFFKQLSAYTGTKDISWLMVQEADKARAGRAAEAVDAQFRLEAIAAEVNRRLQDYASDLGLPVVTRDQLELLNARLEQTIARQAAPTTTYSDELATMREAAARGNQPYAEVDYDNVKRRVYYEQGDEQRVRDYVERMGGELLQSGALGVGGNLNTAFGTPVGGAAANVGFGLDLGQRQFFYRDGEIYQSAAEQTSQGESTDETTGNAFRATLWAEQAAARDRRVTIDDYGRLEAGTHTLEVEISDGGRGEIDYQVKLLDRYSNSLLSESATVPINPRPLAKRVHVDSGQIYLINPRVKKSNVLRSVRLGPPTRDERGLLTARVVDRVPPMGNRAPVYRTLCETTELDIATDDLVTEGTRNERCRELRVRDNDDLSEVPTHAVMRVIVRKLLETIAPPAGEVAAVKQSGDAYDATVLLNQAADSWSEGQSLRLLRPVEDGGLSGSLGHVRANATVTRVGRNDRVANLAKVRVLPQAGGSPPRPGDRLVARDAPEPHIHVRKAQYFSNVYTKRRIQFTPNPIDLVKEPGFDSDAMPLREDILRIYATSAGWSDMNARLDRTATAIASALNGALDNLTLDATFTEEDPPADATHLVHTYLRPVSPSRAVLGVKVLVKRDPSKAEWIDNFEDVMHLYPELRLQAIEEWRP